MRALEITSASNVQFKVFQSLLTAKGIKEQKQFFLMGRKLVEEFLRNPQPNFKAEYLLFDQEVNLQTSIKRTILAKDLFKELDVLGTHAPMLVLSFTDFPEKDLTTAPQGMEVVTPLGDPRNLGALIRTAVGFGVQEIILTQESAHPFLPQAMKASAGSALEITIKKAKFKTSELPMGGENFALELHGQKLHEVKWPKNLRLWVGEEGPGLNLSLEQKQKMKFINIPTRQIESLNASVSSALAIWEWKKSQQ